MALLLMEPGFETILDKLMLAEDPPRMASPNFLEVSLVIDSKRDPVLARRFLDLIARFRIDVVPFTADHAQMAREAYRDYGKGSGSPARLNFGDTMAYALARAEQQPLLYVGDDFIHTDIEAA